MNHFWKRYNDGQMLADLIRYIPGLAKLAYQGQIKSIETKRKYADDTYKGMKLLHFQLF